MAEKNIEIPSVVEKVANREMMRLSRKKMHEEWFGETKVKGMLSYTKPELGAKCVKCHEWITGFNKLKNCGFFDNPEGEITCVKCANLNLKI